MAWYVVWVGRKPGIYLTWVDCYRQVNRWPGVCHKKYNTEAEALTAFYAANHGPVYEENPLTLGIEENPPALEIEENPPALEIEEKPPTEDMKIRRPAFWSWTHVIILFQAMVIAFLIYKLM